MSTLTLAVNDYFKSDLTSDLPSSSSLSHDLVASVSAPVSPLVTQSDTKPLPVPAHLYTGAYTYSKSATDLRITGLDAAPRLWPETRTNSGMTDVSKQLTGVKQLTEIKQQPVEVKPVPEFLVPGSASIPSDNKKDTKSDLSNSPRAGSEAPGLKKLKSSLKLPSLTKLYSTLSLSPKLVRFASRLEKVKMFDGRDSPSTVSLQNTPTGSPKFHDFDLDDYFSSHRNFTDLGFDENSDSDSEDSDTFREYTRDKLYKISSLNFAAPKNIYDRLSSPVYLQQMSLGSDKKLIVLLVMCQNLAFEKSVSVKLTLNNWQSTLIFNNPQYMKSFTSVNFDQFKFVVPLAHLPSALSAQFCIKYDVNGQTHWDNNSSRNYNVVLSSYVPQKPDTFTVQDSFSYKTPTFLPMPKQVSNTIPSVSLEKKSAPPYNYDELISKLILVSKGDTARPSGLSSQSTQSIPGSVSSRPALHTSASLPALKPRYSQSFRAKHIDSKVDLSGKSTGAVPETRSPLALGSGAPNVKPVASFQDSKFNSTSYATLLQTYCFNGASTSAESSAAGSLANLRSNSSSSLNSDFMSAMPTAIPTSFN
ncbi:CIC11C00000004706 [Sungouiella intermedia]|uniref:CIC11C00000004706 n=1 Tax=Sungouiella intermedia TaxID=45354 RepID=A0A1L0BR93_9ASCO|nr:CIC11C00000004706 [[Candida] intermedia]